MDKTEKLTTEAYLKSYCSTDRYRPAMARLALRNGYIYATDGHRAIRIKESDYGHPVEDNPECPNIEAVWPMTALRHIPLEVPIESLRKALNSIPLTPERIECDECEGSGEIECHCCGNDSDCEQCGGKGFNYSTSNLVLDFEKYDIKIQNSAFNSRFVSEVVKGMELENVDTLLIDCLHNKQANLWRFGRFELLIIPYNIYGIESEYIITVQGIEE